MASADDAALDAASLQNALGGQLIGSRVIVLDQTTSTNDEAFALGASGADEGLVVFAENQTAGRGRHGARWESSARKGLWFSILLKPAITNAETARLTDWAAKSIAEAVNEEADLHARIKPPNDIYIGDRKLAGILVEMRAVPRKPHLAIVGIGINVNQSTAEFSPSIRERATSLAIIKERPFDRGQLAVALLRRLEANYALMVAP